MNIGSITIDERMAKFGIVGLSGMALDFAVTWVCKEKWGLNKFLANSLGFSIAVINNFIWNRYWTFAAATTQPLGEQFVKFALVSLSGLAINNLLLYLLLKKIKMNFYLLKLVVIGLVFCWNYLANFLFTFH
jgi:putative flippase GtrA